MKIIGVIPARYRSSRFPGKPLADICGRPMIWWVYRQAKKVEQLDAVYVATDDERIQAACESYGIPVVMTSPDHPTGSDRVAEVAAKVEGDLFINIQGDEPLMDPDLIDALAERMIRTGEEMATAACPIQSPEQLNARSLELGGVVGACDELLGLFLEFDQIINQTHVFPFVSRVPRSPGRLPPSGVAKTRPGSVTKNRPRACALPKDG